MLPRASPDPTTAPRPSSHSPRHPVSTPSPLPTSFFNRPPRPRTSTHGARGSEAAGRGAGSQFDHATPVLRPPIACG